MRSSEVKKRIVDFILKGFEFVYFFFSQGSRVLFGKLAVYGRGYRYSYQILF